MGNDPAEHRLSQWQAIAGTWRFSKAAASFEAPDDASFKMGVALSDVRASDGILRAAVELKEVQESCARLAFGYSSANGSGYSVGIGGWGRAFVLGEYFHGRYARMIAGLGSRDNLEPGKTYELEVQFQGNQVTLSVDGVEVLQQTLPHPLLGEQIGLEAYGDGGVIYRNPRIVKIRPRAFVVMEFGEPYDSFWEEVIQPVADRTGFEAYRADNVFGPGIILQDIVQGIKSSRVVIAEVTPPNPNVYYELGYAHATGTPTILLAERKEEGSKLPFDISGFRCIFYKDAIRGKRKVETELERHLRNILDQNGSRIVTD